MLYCFLILIMSACALGFHNWRRGIYAAICIGLIQDPIRKMIPHAPSFLAMASVPVWLAVMLSAWFSGAMRIRSLICQFPRLGQSLIWFGGYLIVPAALSATHGSNTWMITLLGVLVYAGVFLALICGWRFPLQERDISRILMFYALLTALLLIGGPLEHLGWNKSYDAIGTEALGHIWVTHRTGATVSMIAGFFRGPDIMGWHASLVLMISFIMAVRTRGKWRLFWMALAVWGAGNLWLCGRRKMVSMVPVFMGGYLLAIYWFRSVRRFVPAAVILWITLGGGWYVITAYFHDEAVQAFYLTTFNEVDDQVLRHAVESVLGTLQQAGFWGYGLGMGQQGIHHIDAEKPLLWQESGPSKLVAELGIPGFMLFLVLLVQLSLTAYHILQYSATHSSFNTNAGILAILAANFMSALVSAQVYGDPFIANMLALLMGLALASVRMMPGHRVSEAELILPCRGVRLFPGADDQIAPVKEFPCPS